MSEKATASRPVGGMVMPDPHPDDGEAIDEAWLRTVGFSDYYTGTDDEADLILRLPEAAASPGYIEWLDGRLVLADWLAAWRDPKKRYDLPAKTRGEVRLTLAVFGIEA